MLGLYRATRGRAPYRRHPRIQPAPCALLKSGMGRFCRRGPAKNARLLFVFGTKDVLAAASVRAARVAMSTWNTHVGRPTQDSFSGLHNAERLKPEHPFKVVDRLESCLLSFFFNVIIILLWLLRLFFYNYYHYYDSNCSFFGCSYTGTNSYMALCGVEPPRSHGCPT